MYILSLRQKEKFKSETPSDFGKKLIIFSNIMTWVCILGDCAKGLGWAEETPTGENYLLDLL